MADDAPFLEGGLDTALKAVLFVIMFPMLIIMAIVHLFITADLYFVWPLVLFIIPAVMMIVYAVALILSVLESGFAADLFGVRETSSDVRNAMRDVMLTVNISVIGFLTTLVVFLLWIVRYSDNVKLKPSDINGDPDYDTTSYGWVNAASLALYASAVGLHIVMMYVSWSIRKSVYLTKLAAQGKVI